MAIAFKEISGTVLPKAMLNKRKSSIGDFSNESFFANSSEQCREYLEPYKAVYSAQSPYVIVRGVACIIFCPSLKFSKKLPILYLLEEVCITSD